jgi:murein DD-endopeptidase MepM/ murein hydrolase activator NlpD
MSRHGLLLLVLVVVFALAAAPALAGDGFGGQKSALDAKLAAVQAKIERTRVRETRLNAQIGGLSTQIAALETRVGDIASRMSVLQADLALRHRRLDVLNALYRVQTNRATDLQRAYKLVVIRLDTVLVSIYKSPQPGALEVALEAKSFQDAIDELFYLRLISQHDEAIAQQVASAKHRVAAQRRRTSQLRRQVSDQTNLINARLEQAAVFHNELLTNRTNLSKARAGETLALTVARAQEQAAIKESAAIQAASAQIEARIRAAQQPTSNGSAASSGGAPSTAATPSAAGLTWPVRGPITSPFGPRWGGFHPGIDIGVPTGTPIQAAAAGTVIWCGWESGYGNLVVLDHHNGIATAYAHQSRIAVACNDNVSQGQVIGYVGCTGFCTGPHLHFEVRVNGVAVDPIGYLP